MASFLWIPLVVHAKLNANRSLMTDTGLSASNLCDRICVCSPFTHIECSLRHSPRTWMACRPNGRCNNQALPYSAYCRIGLPLEMNFGSFGLCNGTTASTSGIAMTMTSVSFHIFLQTLELYASETAVWSCWGCSTSIFFVNRTFEIRVFHSYHFHIENHFARNSFGDFRFAQKCLPQW